MDPSLPPKQLTSVEFRVKVGITGAGNTMSTAVVQPVTVSSTSKV